MIKSGRHTILNFNKLPSLPNTKSFSINHIDMAAFFICICHIHEANLSFSRACYSITKEHEVNISVVFDIDGILRLSHILCSRVVGVVKHPIIYSSP